MGWEGHHVGSDDEPQENIRKTMKGPLGDGEFVDINDIPDPNTEEDEDTEEEIEEE